MQATSRVTLLFTSDEHGYLGPAPRLQSEINRARSQNPDGTLLMSAGDVFEGSVDTGVLGVAASRETLERAGYDAVTMGNHDFDRGPEVARAWVEQSPAQVLLCNVLDQQQGDLMKGARPSQVYELNGVRVGVIGVTTPDTAAILPAHQLQGLLFADPVASVRRELESLQAQGVEVVGVLSHLGLPADRELARALPQLDFILGGHTHHALEAPEQVGQTWIAHPGCFRQSMGRWDMTINRVTGQIEEQSYQLISAPQQAEAEGPLKRFVDEGQSRVSQAMNQPLALRDCVTASDPDHLRDEMEELFCQAMLEKSQASMIMVNQKGIRAGLPQGEVKRRDVFNSLPFDNRLVSVELSVKEVCNLYTESFRRCDQTSLTVGGRFEVAVDAASRQCFLLENLPVTPQDAAGPIDASRWIRVIPPDTKIRVATNDYLVAGGLKYFERSHPILDDHGNFRTILEEYLTAPEFDSGEPALSEHYPAPLAGV